MSEDGRSRVAVKVIAWVLLCTAAILACDGCGGRKRTLPADSSRTDATVGAAVESASGSRATIGGIPTAPLLIRVGLTTKQSEARITTSGPARLLAGDQRRIVANLAAGVAVTIRPHRQGLHWQAGSHGGETDLLFLQPNDPEHWLTWGDYSYHGEILLLSSGGKVTVVNIVELEAYLCGVVPWEIGRPGREARAAVEAQAVAARTYTISHLNERSALGFDVWAGVRDQVYRGARDEDAVCNEAIAHTAGLVMRSGEGEIEAYYCSTCGGWTSNVEEVWPRPARSYLHSHRDASGDGAPFCAAARHFSWQVTWSPAQLEHILARTLPEYVDYMSTNSRAAWAGKTFTPRSATVSYRRPGGLRQLEIVNKTTSGRVGRLDVSTEAGVYHVRGDRVRWVLTPPEGDPVILRSALFDLEVTVEADGRSSRITARGHGFGHGVGMCQEGALAMARRGYSQEAILTHYYPGARLEPYQTDER